MFRVVAPVLVDVFLGETRVGLVGLDVAFELLEPAQIVLRRLEVEPLVARKADVRRADEDR